ncbi:MAG: CehA/McbA family metallohydrolase [Ignavibacteriales bacterium]|nr:CehA/McbA family metallohydrolase [Ignavibacteriales bacterium]
MYEYIAAIHIHSLYSDGTGKVEEIAKTASEMGIDFIFLTDHNTLRAKKDGYQKWFKNTLVIVGCEINDKTNKNHYLAFGIDETPSTRLPANKYVEEIKNAGGIGFIAHPFEERSSMKEHPPYPWTDWSTKDFNGIEIWNHMSEWMEGLTEANKYNYFIHPLRSIKAPTKKALRMWDKLNLERKVVGIGGLDAHAHKVNLLGFFEFELFPYKVLFKSIRTHIFLENKIEKENTPEKINKTCANVLSALSNGRCFIANYYHGDAKGFRFFAEDGKKIYLMGDSVKLSNKLKLRVLLPNASADINLIHNGKKVSELNNCEAEFPIKKEGVYRIEVYLENNAWIFSNHIKVTL